MSLAFNFKLTTAQTKLLVTIANYHFASVDGPRSDAKYAVPVWKSPVEGGLDHFVGIAKRLQAKGLISHDPRRSPTYQPTPEGLAVAALVVREAKELVALTHGLAARRRLYDTTLTSDQSAAD